MIKTQRVIFGIFATCLFLVSFFILLSSNASAQTPPECRESGSALAIENCTKRVIEDECGEPVNPTQADRYDQCVTQLEQSWAAASGQGDGQGNETIASTGSLSADCKDEDLTDCRIIGYLRDFVNFLSALVGIVVVIMIAYGGVRYSAARDNPQAAVDAKKHITNAIVALVVYIFIFAILEYLIPGGIF